MFFNFQVFIHSLLFFVGLEILLNEVVFDFFILSMSKRPFLVLFLFSMFLIFVLVGTSKIGKSLRMTPISIVFSITAIGLIFFVDSPIQRQVFTVLISLFYYLGQIGIYRLANCRTDQTARGILAGTSVASLFLFYSLSYAIYLNFTVPIWFMMILFFLITTLVSFEYMQSIKDSSGEAWKYSVVIGLIMMEISWVAHFWPFGYLTTGAVMLIFYYVFWDLVQSYFLKILSKRRVVANVVFFGILTSVVLISSRWLPIV